MDELFEVSFDVRSRVSWFGVWDAELGMWGCRVKEFAFWCVVPVFLFVVDWVVSFCSADSFEAMDELFELFLLFGYNFGGVVNFLGVWDAMGV